MKITAAVVLIACLLSGCQAKDHSLEEAMELRTQILNAEKCSFQAVVTADYGDDLYTFQMECEADSAGNLSFTVIDPETIRGITGHISQDSAGLTFDDKVLAFQTIADGLVTPVTAPWLFMKTLRSGYLKDVAETEQGFEISIDDSYAEESLQLRIRTAGDLPAFAEIFWQGRRILTVSVENFSFL